MMRGRRSTVLLATSLASGALGHGAGVWRDPKHYQSDDSLAGIRFIAESPPHHLTLVSTDNGIDWFALSGSCSGAGMTTITFDFAPKGGPGTVSGTWSSEGGATSIVWPDGNRWTLLERPTAAWQRPTPIDDHVGLFSDPNHYAGASGFAGTRWFRPRHRTHALPAPAHTSCGLLSDTSPSSRRTT